MIVFNRFMSRLLQHFTDRMQIPLIACVCFLHSGLVQAGTIIDVAHNNSLSTLLGDGDKTRMSSPGSDYLVIDNSEKTIKAVNDSTRKVVVIDMNTLPQSYNAAAVRVTFRDYGNGPKIAGFDTDKYEYLVDGRSCGFVYGSRQAMTADGVGNIFAAMGTMLESQFAMLGSYAAMMDECKQARMRLNEHVQRIGLPMRTERKGVVGSEVKSIRTNVELPPDSFIVPVAYTTVSALDEMNAVKSKRHDAPRAPVDRMQMRAAPQPMPR